jgi:hypothetical protein
VRSGSRFRTDPPHDGPARGIDDVNEKVHLAEKLSLSDGKWI